MEDFFMSSLDVADKFADECSPMLNFFRDKTVFLTGATGFLGKLMIEKLLRYYKDELQLG